MSTLAIVILTVVASVLFPILVYNSELGQDGRWRPRGRYGYITKTQGKLRYIWFYAAVWTPAIVHILNTD